MAKVTETYNIGNRDDISIERLLEIIEDMYQQLATNLNKKVEIYERHTDGQTSDTFLSTGTININNLTDKVEMLVARPSSTTVTWKEL